MSVAAELAAKEAEDLYASEQYAAAIVQLQFSINLGDLKSRALKAWMLLKGRKGVVKDRNAAFELVEEGARLNCHHCQGVLAVCYWRGFGCVRDEVRSLELALESSGKGSRYGQYALGELYEFSGGGVARDYVQAIALYQLAAAQNFDGAQCILGLLHSMGQGVAKDLTEGLRWYRLAATQGNPQALFEVAYCYEKGLRVCKDKSEAFLWYMRAQAAGHHGAAAALRRLSAE